MLPIVLDNLLITNYNKHIMNKNLLASVFLSLLLAVGVTSCKEANTDGPQPEPEPGPAKTYEVGDYYDEGLAKGVVAYVEDGA